MNTLSRDKYISDYYECNGGEMLSIDYEISTSCMGRIGTTNSQATTIGYASSAIGIYTFSDNNEYGKIHYATRVTASEEAPVHTVSSIITLAESARKFRVFVQTEAWGNFSGFIKVRNIRVRKVAIQSTDVEYYLSTSTDSLVGGSWVTTAPE